MNFGIEIRNKVTGRAVTLPGRQAVADFLAGLDKTEWEGFACLGELPEPTQLVKAESDASPIVDTSLAPFREIDATLAAGVIADMAPLVDSRCAVDEPVGTASLVIAGDKVYSDDFAGAEPMSALPDGTVVVAGGLPVNISVGDSGAGDSYLPADAAGEQA